MDKTFTPSAIWAQRDSIVYLTVQVDGVEDPTVKLEPTSLYFRGVGGPEKKVYELTVDLNGEIDPAASTQTVRGREIEFILKKSKEGYWPRLTKSSTKHHWLKVDFNKWKEEDESDNEEGGMGGGMGGMPMGGMGGMPGMGGMGADMDFEKMMREMGGIGGGGGKPNFDDMNEPETDSDDEEPLPELE